MVYILDRMFVPDPAGGIISYSVPWSNYLNPAARGRWVGYADLIQALDQNILFNPTAQAGFWTNVYYGLMAQLGNWEFNVKKVDESVEVSPMYKGFYEMVMNEKQNIEIKIKKVIDDIISHTSELELLEHDIRRYKEFYDYFDFAAEESKRKPDEHSLKAVFIDMVDYHSGEGTPGRLSMSFMQQNNIFPTIIQDFYQMNLEEDLEKSDRLKNLSKVEKDMLKTKSRAYAEWKKLFGREVKSRYERLKQLSDSKKAMIEKSKEWIKPYIARHKLLKEGMSEEQGRGERMTSEWQLNVQPTSSTTITVWAWKEFPMQEFYKTSGELMVKEMKKEASFIEKDPETRIYSLKDKWTMENLILNPEIGLKNKYPFINEKWVQKKVHEVMFNDDWFRARKRILNRIYYYYAFLEIKFEIWTTRTATGQEVEDTNIYIRSYWMSRNVLLTKLLELKAKQESLEMEIEDMLGIESKRIPEEKEKPGGKKNPISQMFSMIGKGFEIFGIKDFRFSRMLAGYGPPPYESSFKYRISKFYLVALGRFYFGPVSRYVRNAIMK